MQTLSRGGSDSTPQKKEFAQTPWWVRLLKLCSMLSAKLSHSLICAKTEADSNPTSNLDVWKYWAGPENIVRLDGVLNNIEEPTLLVDDILVEFRRVALLRNHTYRTIISAANANKTLSILNGIESCLLCALQQCSERQDLFLPEVELISSITTSIFNRRSVLMSRCEGLTWKDILSMIHRIVRAFQLFLQACTDRSCLKPLIVPAKKRVHPALRRSLLVVMCLNRWKSSLKYKFKLRKVSVINAFQYVLNRTIFAIIPFNENSLTNSWKGLLSSLQKSDDVISNQVIGMESMKKLLINTPQSSIRIDIMSLLAVSWKNKMLQNPFLRDFSCDGDKTVGSSPKLIEQSRVEFSTSLSKSRHKSAFLCLMNVVQDSVTEFCNNLCQDTIAVPSLFTELNLFYCNIKYLQLVVADKNNPYSFDYSICILKHLKDVLVAIDAKFAELQMSDDRGSGGASATKRQSSREKCVYMRRAASAVVRLLQIISMSTVRAGINLSQKDFEVILDVHVYLIKHFQNIRLMIKSDGIATSQNEPKDGRGKDVNSHRRRCQELIVNPMQFGRIQEGFVVQGEKLLSNFKGIDFTLACWIFITKNSASRSSFLVGKVSHNDAWPLITLRAADMKAEIIFGRANEFERLASHASIPLHAWTHVGVVVEPRKIKLFINGSMDCQVTTAGNARAILYPVIIGACPPGVRTRVDCIKEGFDGLLSNLKYYTRALSPIHVRVIFDKGPPEAHDARENLSYQLLSSSYLMLDSRRLCEAPELCGGVLETFHSLFLSDSSRLRLGSLKVLQKVLCMHDNAVQDFPLSQNELNWKGKGGTTQRKTLMSAEFLSSFVTFQNRLVYYFIRLMGICWFSSTCTKGEFKKGESLTFPFEDNQVSDKREIEDFLSYCPSFVSSPGSSESAVEGSGVTSEGGAIEIPIPREDLILEMCQSINDLLRPLSRLNIWRQAISDVLQHCTSQYLHHSSGGVTPEFSSIDMFGVALFVGEMPLCPFLGADVRSSYCKHPCTVLSIDKATCQSTLLTVDSSKSTIQFITVKTNELSELSENYDSLQLSQGFTENMIALIVKLSEGVGCLLTDCLSVSRRDQSFTHDYILKSCRPYEIFLFHQLLRRLSRSVDGCLGQKDLFDILKSFSIRAANSHIEKRVVVASTARQQQLESGSQISFMWLRSLHFISAAFPVNSHKQTQSDELVNSCSDENDLCESVLSTHLDISPECFKSKYSSLLKSGHVTEFVHCASANPDANVSSLVPHSSGDASAHAFTVDISSLASRGDTPDAKAKTFFEMMFELREFIIKHAKQVVHLEYMRLGHFQDTLQLPWKVVIWQSIVKENEHGSNAVELEGIFRLCSKLLESDGPRITSSIICSVQYAMVTLFRRKPNVLFEMPDNILQSTDVFRRLLLAAFSWLRTHENLPIESAVCYEMLTAFLSLLPLVKIMEFELAILSLCSLAVQRILFCFYNGQLPSEDVIRIL